MELATEMVAIARLTPYARNPRKNAKAVHQVADSLRAFGFRQPIVVDKDFVVVVGHTRLLAAKEIGLTEVPVHVAHDLTPSQARAYRIADNRAAEASTWDDTLLVLELSDLRRESDDTLQLSGFNGVDLARLELDAPRAGETDADDAPAVPDEPETQPGDLWVLGAHRLVCGDATDAAVRRLALDGATPDVVFTDPPYGVEYTSRVDKDRRKAWGAIQNDHLGPAELAALVTAAVPPSRCQYVCASWECVGAFQAALGEPKAVCVWVKSHFGLGKGYRRQHELVLFYGTLNRTDLSDVWRFERAEAYQHPTQKPVALVAKALADSDATNVFDPFCGSGSTLIAAEQLGRPCRAIELEPKYVDVAVERWQRFTSRRAERIQGGGQGA